MIFSRLSASPQITVCPSLTQTSTLSSICACTSVVSIIIESISWLSAILKGSSSFLCLNRRREKYCSTMYPLLSAHCSRMAFSAFREFLSSSESFCSSAFSCSSFKRSSSRSAYISTFPCPPCLISSSENNDRTNGCCPSLSFS